jgi:hypothetical protein
MRVAIIQSNYLPWIGYFDIISNVDLFIFYDDLQFTKNDWRNRNKIKGPDGLQWITIPVGQSEKRLICEVEIKSEEWQRKHWNMLKHFYNKSPFFSNFSKFFEDIYIEKTWKNLSELNQYLIKKISHDFLEINIKFDDSRNYLLTSTKSDRVLELLKKVGASSYLSGPSAKNYLKESSFSDNDIKLDWMDYDAYEEYPQLYPPFSHYVSIVDLLFNVGPDAKFYFKSS